MDLDRVSTAQGDLRPALACQMGELTLFTRLAAGAWLGRGDLGLLIAPYVKREQCAAQLVLCAHQKFDGLSRLDRPHKIDRAIQDSRCVAGFHRAFRRSREYAG